MSALTLEPWNRSSHAMVALFEPKVEEEASSGSFGRQGRFVFHSRWKCFVYVAVDVGVGDGVLPSIQESRAASVTTFALGANRHRRVLQGFVWAHYCNALVIP